MKQTPKGALRPWRLFDGQVGVAGPEAERRIANGEGASFGRGRPGYGALG